jgi:hypothetical protein
VSEENGEQNRLKAEVLNAAMLREIGDRLLWLQDHFKEATTEGFAEPREPIVVTVAGVTIEPETKPWFSVIVMNDGLVNVDVLVMSDTSEEKWTRPRTTRWHTVLPTETYTVTFTKGQVKYVQLRTLAGVSTARVVGIR